MKKGVPQIFIRDGKECYLDPIRKKLIYITPEETVRQRAICYIVESLGVPEGMIAVEQHLAHYGIKTKRRADIVIHATDENDAIYPLAVIECKAPEVYLDEKAYNQMIDYCEMLGATYVMLTNSIEEKCFKYDEDSKSYIPIEELPCYKDMVDGEFKVWEIGELPPRIAFNKLEAHLKSEFDSFTDKDYGYEISKLTPMKLAVPVFNFLEALLDTRVKMQAKNYDLFKLVEDYGVRMVSYGNAAGGVFYGPYRSFLVDVNGSTEFYSISGRRQPYCRRQ